MLDFVVQLWVALGMLLILLCLLWPAELTADDEYKEQQGLEQCFPGPHSRYVANVDRNARSHPSPLVNRDRSY